MFILGVLSLVQVAALPGLIVLRLLRFKGTFWQYVIYTFGLSLFANYCAVFLLVFLNLYSRPIILTLFTLQVLWAIWLHRDELQNPLPEIFQDLWDRSISALAGLFPSPEDNLTPNKKAVQYFYLLFTFLMLTLAMNRMWWASEILVENFGTIFDGWDPVFSWNRWAGVWYAGDIPLDTRFYPQLVPINWSLTYVFLGGTAVQMFAKAIMPLFVIGIFLQLFDLGVSLRQPGFFVAIILFRSLIVRFIGVEINNGYVDTAAAFFALLPFYSIFKAQAARKEPERLKLWTLGFFFAAAASVTKQPGVLIFPVYLFLVYLLLLRTNRGDQYYPNVRRSVLMAGTLAVLVPLIWYGYKSILIYSGIDESEVLLNAAYAAQVYGNVDLASQITQSIRVFGVYLVLFPLVFFTLPLLPSLARWLFALFILPFPIVWAVMASYTTRNLAISLPLLALVGGLAVEVVVRHFFKLLTQIQIGRWRFVLIPAALSILLVGLAYTYPDSRIRFEDMAARQKLFSPSLNRELQRLYSANPETLVLTNYPVEYVLGRENSQISFWYTDVQEFEGLMRNEKITHLLVPSTVENAEIVQQIEHWEDVGFLTFLMQDQGSSVIPYRLFAVNR